MIRGKNSALTNASILLMLTFLVGGCAGIQPPTPQELIKKPFGDDTVRVGMTKKEVELIWRKPDEIRTVEDTARWKGPRELWVYRARYSDIPVDVDFFSKDRKLYFDGDHLTNIEEGS